MCMDWYWRLWCMLVFLKLEFLCISQNLSTEFCGWARDLVFQLGDKQDSYKLPLNNACQVFVISTHSSLLAVLWTFENFLFESKLELLIHENRLLNGCVGTGLVSFEAKMNFWSNFKVWAKLLELYSFCCMGCFRNLFDILP